MHNADMTRKSGKAQLGPLESVEIVVPTPKVPGKDLQNADNNLARVQG